MTTRDTLEERDAIIAEGERVTRQKAEDLAAKQHGFPTWDRAMKEMKGSDDAQIETQG